MSEKRKDNKGRVLQTGEYYDEKNHRYMFRKMVNGRRETITAPDLVTLREEKNKLLCLLDKGTLLRNSTRITLNKYFDFWYDNYAKSGRKATTCKNYKDMYNCYVRKTVGNKPIKKITKLDCQTVINDMADKGLVSGTMGILKTCMNGVFENAIDEDLITKNPMKNVEIPQTEKNERKDVDIEQVKSFLAFIRNSYRFRYTYAAFATLFNTGMRQGELRAITWDDIDFLNNTITINKTLNSYRRSEYGYSLAVSSPKSKKSIRTIKMNSTLKEILVLEKMQRRKCNSVVPYVDERGVVKKQITGFVFLNKVGNAWNNNSFQQMRIRILEEYNRTHEEQLDEFCFHEARHTFASLAHEIGADLKAVSDYLGHANINTTANLYTHLTKKKQSEQETVLQTIKIS